MQQLQTYMNASVVKVELWALNYISITCYNMVYQIIWLHPNQTQQAKGCSQSSFAAIPAMSSFVFCICSWWCHFWVWQSYMYIYDHVHQHPGVIECSLRSAVWFTLAWKLAHATCRYWKSSSQGWKFLDFVKTNNTIVSCHLSRCL